MSLMVTAPLKRIVLGNTETEDDYERGVSASTSFERGDDGYMYLAITQTKPGGRTYTTRCRIPLSTYAIETNRLLELDY